MNVQLSDPPPLRLDFGLTRAPARILFGPGQRQAIGPLARDLGRRALVCTDARFGALPEFREMIARLEAAGVACAVFDRTEAELPLAGVEACVADHRGFRPEMVIGIGGGSCLDLAKLVGLLLCHPGPLSDYYGEFKVPGPVLPVIAVPTTAGTGSEVTPVAVVGDPARTMKVGISSDRLIPHTALCDPELTLTCPPGLTAVSGADALAHAIEAYSAVRRPADPALATARVFVGKNGLSDLYAREAVALLFRHLPRAVERPDDIDARAAVMTGSLLAGLAFGTAGTSAAHALQYPVGARTKTAHGLGIAVLLPHAMRHNLPAAGASYAELAQAAGVPGGAEGFVAAVADLFARLGLPPGLRALGLEAADIDALAAQSLSAARLVENNPRPLDQAAVTQILRAALEQTHPKER